MRTLYPVALAALVVSCHLDKLLNGGGGNGPPSEAAPARVAFSSSLGNARAGQPISPPVQVTVQDSAGRVTLRDTLVTLSLAANPSGDSLRGKKQVRSVNGVATFAELRLDKADSGYTLTAAAPNLHPDTSAAFSVMPAPATVLAFTGQPSVTTQVSAMKLGPRSRRRCRSRRSMPPSTSCRGSRARSGLRWNRLPMAGRFRAERRSTQ